jgi:hypothetical protein
MSASHSFSGLRLIPQFPINLVRSGNVIASWNFRLGRSAYWSTNI